MRPAPPEFVNRRLVILAPLHCPALARTIARAGWAIVRADDDVPIVLIDPAAGGAGVDRDRSAVIAITPDASAASQRMAYAAGATHWLARDAPAEIVAATLDFAGRHARRVRRLRFEARDRRAEDIERAGDAPLAAWIAARAGAGPIAAIVIALTRFEFVNAAFGRATGDALIAAVRARIERWMAATFEEEAVIARRDGAEMIVLARSGDPHVADTLEAVLAPPYEVAGVTVNLGSRVGVALSTRRDDARGLLRRARRALPDARGPADAATRGAVTNDGVLLDRLAADFHRALDGDEIRVLFQPQATMAGRIVGVEALARWEHPLLGPLGADRLFAAADRAGLGAVLSDRIQQRALAEASAWPAPLARLRLSINVTAADLACRDFAAAFLARIDASVVARGRVIVEIVETGLIDQLDRAATVLAQLRGAGCRIAIDDFGTGYSSLTYLQALPIDHLKFDRSLTLDIAGSDRDRMILRGVMAIARSLGLGTIAEGVETEDQRRVLAEEGCDLYQGFLCAPPVDASALAALIA